MNKFQNLISTLDKISGAKPQERKSVKIDVPPPQKQEDSYGELSEREWGELLSPAAQGKVDRYIPLDCKDPIELLYLCSPRFANGVFTPYKWQIETNLQIASADPKPTIESPLKFYLRAANGSGKDAFVNAPLALWFCVSKIRSRCIITSSSYSQLKNQTENYIRTLAQEINIWSQRMGLGEILIIKREHIVCKTTRSEIVMFVTDDPGRAEGYHPFPDHPDAEMMMMINEAKSVPEEIFEALKRCTGFNYWIEVSSPKQRSGHFYNMCMSATDWSLGWKPGRSLTRKVVALDCKHFTEKQLEEAAEEYIGGKENSLFRSIYYAEFSSLDEMVMIPIEFVERCILAKPKVVDLGKGIRCGIDLAAGGDENSTYVVRGNEILDEFHFREKDIIVGVSRIKARILDPWKDRGLLANNVYADDGGVGRGGLDYLDKHGWTVRRILNNSAPLDTNRFGSRGAELWYQFGLIVQHRYMRLDASKDRLLVHQLGTRYYKTSSGGRQKIILEPKPDARDAGRPSPDRADALVLAFTGITWKDFAVKLRDYQELEENPQLHPRDRIPTTDLRELMLQQRGIAEKQNPTLGYISRGGARYMISKHLRKR